MKKVGVSVSQPSGFSPNLVGILSGRRFLSFREGIIARKKSGLQSGTRRDLVGNPSGFSRDIVGLRNLQPIDDKKAPALDLRIQCWCFFTYAGSVTGIRKILDCTFISNVV